MYPSFVNLEILNNLFDKFFIRIKGYFEKNSFSRIAKDIRVVFGRVFFILISALILFYSVRGVLSDTYYIESISLPESIIKNGLSENEVSGRIILKLRLIQSEVTAIDSSDSEDIHKPIFRFNDAVASEDIKVFGVSLSSLKKVIRLLLNVQDKVISGSIVRRGNELEAKIHFPFSTETIDVKEKIINDDEIGCIDVLIEKLSEKILLKEQPATIGWYFLIRKDYLKANKVYEGYKNDYDMIVLKGYIALAKGHYSESLDYFSSAEQIDDREDYNLYFGKATAYMNSEDYKNAIIYFEKARQINDSDPRLFVNMGLCSKLIGHFDLAKDYFTQATMLKSNYASAYYNLGLLFKSNNKEEAKRYFNLAIKSKPNHVEAIKELNTMLDGHTR
ncbi:tetratricopeptide repeat protein [Leptospira andrefontaineae]|uniref:Uncharacterized protein n=1 Tax=Leptospira andrefontaineae TaxID=2484976 RepID=A0A4R9GXL3_9LEPT|nr:tetratricopeptide repeat protein [Leptospira andrefontaineae]TGK36657.1 hypothetical protein EHO65_17875 [Leptospira andrefontaineae]